MAISGTDGLEVPTIYKAEFSWLWFRGYLPSFYGQKYGTFTSILGVANRLSYHKSSINPW